MEKVTEKYAIYRNDCMNVVREMPDKSIDLAVYSPPFAGLYNYSSSEYDFSNCESKEQFLEQYEFLIKEMARITKSGRINAVHTQDVLTDVTKNYLWDLPHHTIALHEKYGFYYVNKITIWKEPLKVRLRTMAKSLTHKSIVEDSTNAFPAQPDYLLVFKKGGENKVAVTHENGLSEYYGRTPLLAEMETKYGTWETINKKYKGWKDHRTNKLSHIIWQRYASSVWDDIRESNVLPFKQSKDEDDEKHVHPLQLDVIQRLIELYSNRKEVIFTPFMGVGSEVYGAVKMDRFGIGVELKESYYKQAIKNLDALEIEMKQEKQELF